MFGAQLSAERFETGGIGMITASKWSQGYHPLKISTFSFNGMYLRSGRRNGCKSTRAPDGTKPST